jgi:hypothetical protein
VHGLQEGRHFHGFYYDFCFLPLYVFCGERLLVSYLRECNIDSAKHAWAILALLVKALRKRWPEVKITLRADSSFCRWKMLRWCERVRINCVVGLAKNERLHALSARLQRRAERKHRRSGHKVRLFGQFQYKAKTWDKKRRVIAKAEHSDRGANPRYVVTNLEGGCQALYDELYCARGEMENRIKEQQLGLSSDRTSCHAWWANQFRLLLSSVAYVLLEALRRIGLRGTELAHAQVGTIRLRLLKIGAIVTRNTRRIRLWLSSSFTLQELFCSCHQGTRRVSRGGFLGAGASTATAHPEKLTRQEQSSSWSGKLELSHNRMRRVFRIITTPIFSSRKRMVVTCALANSLPLKPITGCCKRGRLTSGCRSLQHDCCVLRRQRSFDYFKPYAVRLHDKRDYL